jgi:hypothetical protein
MSGRLALRQEDVPVRLSTRRFRLWGIGLSLVSAAALVGSAPNGFIDFPQFWAAARTVGTPDLLDASRHLAWEAANGIRPNFFLYPPGVAWVVAPLGSLSVAAAFWVHALIMILCGVLAGAVGAGVYGLDRRIGIVASLAWAPVIGAAALGQNTPLALLLALLTIWGTARDRDAVAGLAVGLLLYKPTLALPLLGLLLLRRRWAALAVASVLAAVWYVLGVTASAGDWQWPIHWISGLSDWYATDVAGNANKAVSLSGLLIGWHLPTLVWGAVAVALVAASLPRLVRAPAAEAGAGACLVGLAVSPHSLNYEGAMLLPIILWAAGRAGTGIAEPYRTWLIVPAYFAAFEYLVSPTVGLSLLAVITIVATAVWLSGVWRVDTRAAGGEPLADPGAQTAT